MADFGLANHHVQSTHRHGSTLLALNAARWFSQLGRTVASVRPSNLVCFGPLLIEHDFTASLWCDLECQCSERLVIARNASRNSFASPLSSETTKHARLQVRRFFHSFGLLREKPKPCIRSVTLEPPVHASESWRDYLFLQATLLDLI